MVPEQANTLAHKRGGDKPINNLFGLRTAIDEIPEKDFEDPIRASLFSVTSYGRRHSFKEIEAAVNIADRIYS
jgi:hypothetical protein